MDNLGDQNDALAPPTTPKKKIKKNNTKTRYTVPQSRSRGKWPHTAATAQGLMFNAGHVGPTEGMLRVMAASVMAVAGVGLIQTKKKTLRTGWSVRRKLSLAHHLAPERSPSSHEAV